MKRTLLAAAFLTGCYLQPAPTRDPGPTVVAYKVDDKEAYGRILRSIVAVDLNVELKDVDAGIVKTEWHNFDMEAVGCAGMGHIRRRVRFIITAAHGECRIKGESAQTFVGSTAGPAPYVEERGLTEKEIALLSALAAKINEALVADR